MAEFTDELAGVNNRIRVQDPGPQGPSFLAGLADTASTAIEGISNIRENRRIARARRAEEEQAGALNSLELARQSDRESQFLDSQGIEISVPGEVRATAERLGRMQEGVNQGRLPGVRMLTKLEAETARLFREYPEHASSIAQYMRDEGLDHFIYREARLQDELQDAEDAASVAERQAILEYGQQHFDPETWEGMTAEERVNQSSRLRAAENNLQRNVDMAQNRDTLAQREQTALDNELISDVVDVGVTEIAPPMNQTFTALTSGQISQSQAATQFRQHLSSLEARRDQELARVRAAGGSQDAVDDINAIFDRHVTVLDRYINDLSYQAAVNQFTASAELDFFQAVPQIAALAEVPGAGPVIEYMLGGLMIDSVLGENGASREAQSFFQDYQGPQAARARTTQIGNYNFQYPTGGRLSEDLGLYLSAPDAASARPSIGGALRRVDETFGLIGDASPETIERNGPDFIGILGMYAASVLAGEKQIVDAAMGGFETNRDILLEGVSREVNNRRNQPQRPDEGMLDETAMAVGAGNPNVRQFTSRWTSMANYIINNELAARDWNPVQHYRPARNTLFNPLTRDAIEVSAQQDPEFARQVFRAGGLMLSEANGYQPNAFGLGSDRVTFDAESGRFVSETPDRGIGRDNRRSSGQYQLRPEWPRQTAMEANRILDTMVELSDYDPELPDSAMSERERRAYYATGRVPEREVSNADPSKRGSSTAKSSTPTKAKSSTPTKTETASDYISMAVAQEGGSQSTGYIPTAGSGVTVGVGFDLGQWSETELRNRLGLSEELIEKLSPYVGLSTQSAVEAQELDPANLQLTVEEEEAINSAILEDSYTRARSVPAWNSLDQSGREALVSLRHWAGQLGADSMKLAPGGTNYLWPVLSREDATTEDVVTALRSTLADMPDETEARYNRIERLIRDLT